MDAVGGLFGGAGAGAEVLQLCSSIRMMRSVRRSLGVAGLFLRAVFGDPF
jgi:hypothetical protein